MPPWPRTLQGEKDRKPQGLLGETFWAGEVAGSSGCGSGRLSHAGRELRGCQLELALWPWRVPGPGQPRGGDRAVLPLPQKPIHPLCRASRRRILPRS